MRQLAERYVCDRGRLVVECLSCGKRKEDAAEESNPPVTGVLFLCQRSGTGCAIGPGSRSNIPPTARVVTAAMPKTTHMSCQLFHAGNAVTADSTTVREKTFSKMTMAFFTRSAVVETRLSWKDAA
jgi:hypothetical protein